MDAGITDGVGVTMVTASSRLPAVTEAARGKGCVSGVRESQGMSGSSGSRVHRAARCCSIC